MEAGGDAGFRGGDLEDEDGAGEVMKISIQLTLQITKLELFSPIIPPGCRTSPNFVVFFSSRDFFFFLVCIGVSLLSSSAQKEGKSAD